MIAKFRWSDAAEVHGGSEFDDGFHGAMASAVNGTEPPVVSLDLDAAQAACCWGKVDSEFGGALSHHARALFVELLRMPASRLVTLLRRVSLAAASPE